MTDVEENADTESEPGDFLDVFDDNKFLDEMVDIVTDVVPCDKPVMVRNDDSENTKSNDGEPNDENKLSPHEEEPEVRLCLEGIDKLTKSIQRRKQKLRKGNERVRRSNGRRSYSHDRGRSKTPPFNRGGKYVRNRDRRSPATYQKRGRSRSRSRERRSNRSRDRRSPRNRRDRSRSKSPSNQPRGMSFIEELEHKFAENGQDFPEKNLLLQIQARKGIDTSSMPTHAFNMAYSQCEVTRTAPPYMQPMQMPMYNQPYQPSWNGSYMMGHSMNTMHPMQSIPLPTSIIGGAPLQQTETISSRGFSLWNPPTNKAEAVAKCRNASKVLRSEENKVPKLRFLYTKTSMPLDSNEEKTPPLQTRKNVQFELTAEDQQSVAPLNFVPPRTRDLVKILGYDANNIISRLRLKEFADQMIHDIEDMDTQKKKTKEKKFSETGSQTESYKCSNCINRDSKTYVNKAVQIDVPKQISIRTQTNERDYRDPLIRSLSRMTPGQLVAIDDFAKLICEPRPSTSVEIFKVREQLMDIFNLAERGPEAIEAEWERKQEIRRRTMGMNNQVINGVPLDQLDLRATMRGSSDNNMGRIPPPPPILANYHLNDLEIDMRRAAEEEALEQRRLQQLRFEEDRRNFELENEQRMREIEWEREREREREREQQIIIQQQHQHQQMQLQLQREQEEVALLEMSRNERKRCARGRGNWGGGRGRGRY